MNILEEISGFSKKDMQTTFGVCFYVFNFEELYLSGEYKILELNADKIVVKAKKKTIEIVGENLTVKSVLKKELFVFGNIKGVNLL